MTTSSRRLVAALLVLLLVTAGCGDETETAQGERQGGGRKSANGAPGGKKAANEKGSLPGKDSDGDGVPDQVDPDTPVNDRGGGPGDGGVPPDGGTDNDAVLATASARYTEPDPDAKKSGLTPDYAEIVEVAVEGLGDDLRLAMTFAGAVPDRMPDKNTIMVVGIGTEGERKDQGYAFGAQGTVDGWKVYAGGKEGARGFPGEFAVEGARIVMTLPWSYVGGPHEFKWYANASWFRSIASVSHYAFDPLPNKGGAQFPN